jgi:hypothetical protein
VVTTPSAGGAELTARRTLDRTIYDGAVRESSGLARSTYARDVLWTHNDSGDGPRVFAIGSDGRTKAVVRLAGADARDWEDIATGPGHSIWVGDIGDNATRRTSISVYRFVEPTALHNTTVPDRKYNLVYPDGRHNAEGLMVNPGTGRVYVVTKATYGGGVYAAPKTLSTTSLNRLTKVAPAPAEVTAAAFSPNGSGFTLCNYGTAFVYPRLGAAPVRIAKPPLRQGESIEYGRGGQTLFMGSEGWHSPVYRLQMSWGY